MLAEAISPRGGNKQIRVVLVDDHPALLAGVRDFLEEASGIKVVGSTGRGVEALDLVGRLRPDVLVLDLRLPDMAGLDVARQVRASHPEVAVLILTGWDSGADTEALLGLGVRGYLSKNQPCEEIADAVRVAALGGTLLGSLAVRSTPQFAMGRLTAREHQVLQLLQAGCRNRDIAAKLHVGLDTVEYHVRHVLHKLGVRSRWELRGQTHSGDVPGRPAPSVDPVHPSQP